MDKTTNARGAEIYGERIVQRGTQIKVVQYMLEGHMRKEASEKFCAFCTPIEKWVNLYKLHSTEGLLGRNLVGIQKGFVDGEFRLKRLQYKQEHHLSCTQIAMNFCLNVVTMCQWEKNSKKKAHKGL